MFGRNFILIAACWVVLAVPTLCMGGLLLHPCAAEVMCCDVERGCDTPAKCGDEPTGSCKHEGDCDNDPCRMFVATGDLGVRGGGRQFMAVQLEVDALCPCLDVEPTLIALEHTFGFAALVEFTPPPLPCHESDLPLLI